MAQHDDARLIANRVAALEATAELHDQARQRLLDVAERNRMGGKHFRGLGWNERDRADQEAAIAQELRDRAERLGS